MRYRLTVFCLAIILLTLAVDAQKKPSFRENPGLQAQQAKEPVRQVYEEMFTRGRYELVNQAFAPNCIVHFGGRTIGLQEAVAEGKGWRSAAPDLVMAIEQINVSGEMVNVTWAGRGTHTGQGHGLKPTGRRFQMTSSSRFHVVNGKIVEVWNEEYRPELFRQLGVSKTTAFMFFTTERLLSALGDVLPDRIYSSLLQ